VKLPAKKDVVHIRGEVMVGEHMGGSAEKNVSYKEVGD
jgi:hypothetical protein